MTLSFQVVIPEDEIRSGNGNRYLTRALEAVGYAPIDRASVKRVEGGSGITVNPDAQTYNAPPLAGTLDEPDREMPDKTPNEGEGSTDVPSRVYGTADEGKTRRNKEQMAEDKEIEALWPRDPAYIPTNVPAAALLADLKAGNISAETPNISTGEERIDPTSEDDKKQDAADEASEAAQTSGGELTLDDLRQAAGSFQKLHGMATAMEVIPQILGCGLHEVEESKIGDAIKALNDYNGAEVKTETAFEATKADVIEEMLLYAETYDGQREDMSAMPIMTADRPKIFAAATGDATLDGLSKLPDDPKVYGSVVMAFREAREKNPFERKAAK